MKKIGQRVVITQGMREFIGATGEIIDTERDGSTVMYRVRLFKPVMVPGVGDVTDDLWSGPYLRNIQYVPNYYRALREPDEIMAANDADLIL
jgi:hypothetical protein